MTRRRLVTLAATLGLLAGTAGAALSQGSAGASAAIRVFQFQPGALEVRAGKGMSGGTVFAERGVYPYFCARHASMRGEVVVR
jgi:plastocyanin